MFLQQSVELLGNFWISARGIFWFFVISVLVAAAINALKLDRKVVHLFKRAGIWSLVGALLLGLVSPF